MFHVKRSRKKGTFAWNLYYSSERINENGKEK